MPQVDISTFIMTILFLSNCFFAGYILFMSNILEPLVSALKVEFHFRSLILMRAYETRKSARVFGLLGLTVVNSFY